MRRAGSCRKPTDRTWEEGSALETEQLIDQNTPQIAIQYRRKPSSSTNKGGKGGTETSLTSLVQTTVWSTHKDIISAIRMSAVRPWLGAILCYER